MAPLSLTLRILERVFGRRVRGRAGQRCHTLAVPDVNMEVQLDHLERLTRSETWNALAELVWNGFDAEATNVTIEFDSGAIARIDEIRVIDNGHGIEQTEALEAFSQLGGSWKKYARGRLSKNGKVLLHGEKGQGRLRAFALGDTVEWDTIVETDDGNLRTVVVVERNTLKTTHVADQPEPTTQDPGTTVRIYNTTPKASWLQRTELVSRKLAEIFAPHLRQSPTLSLYLGDDKIDPAALEDHSETYALTVDGYENETIELEVIEWNVKFERALHLCDSRGMSMHELHPLITAPNYNFTAYIRWDGFRDREEMLSLAEMNDELRPVIDAARDRLQAHFTARHDQRDVRIIQRWVDEGSYPYKAKARTAAQQTERQVFDLAALAMNASAPSFAKADIETRKMTLALLREAVERSPDSLHRILESVGRLDKQRMDELAALLDRTTLPNIIIAARTATDRDHLHRGAPRSPLRPHRRGRRARPPPQDPRARALDLRRQLRARHQRARAHHGAQAPHQDPRPRRHRTLADHAPRRATRPSSP